MSAKTIARGADPPADRRKVDPERGDQSTADRLDRIERKLDSILEALENLPAIVDWEGRVRLAGPED